MNFANVTDIKIPNGNVIKIEETDTGRVLWEKNAFEINPVWQSTKTSLVNIHVLPSTPVHIIARSQATSNYVGLFATTDVYDTVTYQSASEEAGVGGYINISDGAIGAGQKIRYIAASKDVVPNIYNNQKPGLLLVHLGLKNTYGFMKISSSVYRSFIGDVMATLNLNISEPTNRVYITLAQDRDEFLVTGIPNGTIILPTNFNSSTPVNFDAAHKFLKTCRVPDLDLYFATNDTRNIFYSTDGKSWNDTQVFTYGTVLGVEYASVSKKLCAINAYEAEIALSTDGITWNVKNAPFTNAKAFDYSPDYDIFCVVDNNGAYLTRDFSKWISVPLANNFTDLLYTRAGVFVAHQDGAHDIYFLFTDEVLNIRNTYDN